MTTQEIAAIISVARRAPLANMAEAEAVDQLLRKLALHFDPGSPAPAELKQTTKRTRNGTAPPQDSKA